MRISVLAGAALKDEESTNAVAGLCRLHGARLWTGEGLVVESHMLLAARLSEFRDLDLGLGVAVAPLRSPMVSAALALSLAMLTEGRLALGYGSGPPYISGYWGSGLASKVGDYINEVRAELADLAVGLDDAQEAASRVELGAGVLREGMATVAGRTADFFVTWLAGARTIADRLIPAVEASSRAANRSMPRAVSYLPAACGSAADDGVRLALATFGNHVRMDHHRQALAEAGVVVGDDWKQTFRGALDAGMFAYGSVDDIRSAVEEFRAAGVSELVLNLSGVYNICGGAVFVRQLDQILTSLADVGFEEEEGDL